MKLWTCRCGEDLTAVAPFAGAWIEIKRGMLEYGETMSLPSRERGLKWSGHDAVSADHGRSLRGSVD